MSQILCALFGFVAFMTLAVWMQPTGLDTKRKTNQKTSQEMINASRERILFDEICKAWVNGNERWFLSDYIVSTETVSW